MTARGLGRRSRILLLSMYPLDEGMWGPTVRIARMRDELSRLVGLEVISGYRGARRAALARYVFSGGLRGLDGIYVESSTFLPAEADLAFLGLARALRIPVLTYVRDAYQLFADYSGADSWRRRMSVAAFRPMIRALRGVSSRMAFPTRGLAEAVLGPAASGAAILPPGAPAPVDVPAAPGADRLLFVGDARLPAQGGARLLEAVARARELGVAVRLDVVSRPGQEPPGPHADWLTIHRAEGRAIHALLPGVLATVIPRPRNAYNDLALPIKLMEYLSYRRPLLVTDCVEQARLVDDAACGLVVSDDVEALATGIARLVAADSSERERWAEGAARAAERHAWANRARDVVELLVPAAGRQP